MNANSVPITKFRLGHIVTTPNALEKLSQDDILVAIQRHQAGDWGDMCESDRKENELSLQKGLRLLSVYRSTAGSTFWLITEANRSVTTILMPEDH